MAAIARGHRNCNPGNIKASAIDWDGEIKPSQDPVFCQFKAPWWGIRAMAKILNSYYHRHGLTTVAGLIGRYAPHTENETSSYTNFVAGWLDVEPDSHLILTFDVMVEILKAMISVECGSQPYTWELTTGLIMAGFEPAFTIVSNYEIDYTGK